MNATAKEPTRQAKTPAVAKPKGKPTRKVYKAFSDDVPLNQSLIHQAVVTWLAGARQGTKAQKNRGERARRRRQALAPERHRPGPRRHPLQPLVARRWPHLCRQPA